jgi:signal transduction histidine kinase/ActR/RegA family two-component response regulator
MDIALLTVLLLVSGGLLFLCWRRSKTLEAQKLQLQGRLDETLQELRGLQGQLKTAEDEAVLTEQSKSEFLANLTHEIRTHLNVIVGYTQIFNREKRLTKRQRKSIGVIHQHSEHLSILLSEVLDLSQIESHDMHLEPTNFNLRRFLGGVTEIIRTQAEEKGLKFTTELAADLPRRVRGDERRLRQVLLAVLNNAIKFTNKGSVVFRVDTCDYPAVSIPEELDVPSEYSTYCVRFRIEDTGIGIPAEHLPDIFLPFHLVRNTTLHKKGIRLGLAISHQLVHLMGGELEVASTLRKGTTFWFSIPLPEAIEEEELEAGQNGHKVVGFRGALRKLLIADDTYENRVVLKEMLLPLGFGIIEAIDGFDVLAKAAQHRPDLILMDLSMPVLSGFEAIRHIRQMPVISDVTVVGMSASILRQIQQENFRAGGDDFLAKPIHLDDLLDCLQRHLKLDWVYDEDVNSESESVKSA